MWRPLISGSRAFILHSCDNTAPVVVRLAKAAVAACVFLPPECLAILSSASLDQLRNNVATKVQKRKRREGKCASHCIDKSILIFTLLFSGLNWFNNVNYYCALQVTWRSCWKKRPSKAETFVSHRSQHFKHTVLTGWLFDCSGSELCVALV